MHPSEASALVRRGVDPIMTLDRNTRRRWLESVARRRKTGAWGSWERVTFPRGTVGHGWAAEFTSAHKNGVWCVLDRTLPDGTRHLAVSSPGSERPTWPEMQRIKSELAGVAATAVEVYPPDAEVVDDADMYHLWVLPAGLPFTLATRRTSNEDPARDAVGRDGRGVGEGKE